MVDVPSLAVQPFLKPYPVLPQIVEQAGNIALDACTESRGELAGANGHVQQVRFKRLPIFSVPCRMCETFHAPSFPSASVKQTPSCTSRRVTLTVTCVKRNRVTQLMLESGVVRNTACRRTPYFPPDLQSIAIGIGIAIAIAASRRSRVARVNALSLRDGSFGHWACEAPGGSSVCLTAPRYARRKEHGFSNPCHGQECPCPCSLDIRPFER